MIIWRKLGGMFRFIDENGGGQTSEASMIDMSRAPRAMVHGIKCARVFLDTLSSMRQGGRIWGEIVQ